MKNGGPKRPAKPVDFLNHRDDHDCVLLASLGFSTHLICKRTGLSPSQVTYRLQKGGLTKANHMSRTDFRNGTSQFSEMVIKTASKLIDHQLLEHLRDYL